MITGANDLFQRPIAVSVAKALLYPGSQVTASTENSSVYNDSDTCTIPADDETEAVDSFSTAMTDASAVARYGLNAISTHHQLLDRDAALRRISSALIQRRRLALVSATCT